MKLFDFIKVLFGNGKKANDKWEKLTSYDKSKNAFMTNRLMSAKFPTQANLFNKLRTDPSAQADAWRLVGNKFNRVPGFIYTKTKKQTKSKKKWIPNYKAVELYMKFNEIGDREFNEALNLNFEEVKKSIQILEKQLLNDRAE
tara:strand:- start:9184 stop:9612 length:429 start_codon:yes stop_codon:yes gene_type:complete